MSQRIRYYRELLQWGYVGMVGVALAFTTITVGSAKIDAAVNRHRPNRGITSACFFQPNSGDFNPQSTCDAELNDAAPFQKSSPYFR
jgi:hypothetical protein